MTVSINDKFGHASNGTIPIATTLASQKTSGASSMSLTAATGWPTDTVVFCMLYQITAAGAVVSGSVTTWKGILSGTTVGTLTLRGGTDATYPAGSIAVVAPTDSWADDLVDGILAQHKQDGTHIALTNTGGMTNTGGITTDTLTASGAVSDNTYALSQYRLDTHTNFIVSGCLWTPDAAGSTLLGSMTSGVVWIAGKRLTVASISGHTFTASKDTYFDIQDNGDGTAKVFYTSNTLNAASPALGNSGTTANTIRVAIITSGGSSLASTAVNQGQVAPTGPIVSSTLLSIADSIGNLIHPADPTSRLLSYRYNATASGTQASVYTYPYLKLAVIVPTGRNIKIHAIVNMGQVTLSTQTTIETDIQESGVTIIKGLAQVNGANAYSNDGDAHAEDVISPSAGLHNYTISVQIGNGNLAVNWGRVWAEVV